MKYVILLIVLLVSYGCATSSARRAWERDVFTLKKRMLDIERGLDLTRRAGADQTASTNKRFLSGLQRIDALEKRHSNVLGMIDALKVGVITGRYPGLDSESESVAGAITALQARITQIEEAQTTLLKEFKTLLSMYDKKKSVKRSKKRKKIKNLAELRNAFAKKRYRYVFEDAQAVVARLKGASEREDAMYLFAESTFKLGKIRDAALHFNELLDKARQDSKYVTIAKVRLGDSFRLLGDMATARLFYQEVVDNYPDSAEAKQAIAKLEKIGAK